MSEKERSLKIAELKKKIAENRGSKCEVYSRIVGYHRPVENWNEGKKEDFKNRTVYSF